MSKNKTIKIRIYDSLKKINDEVPENYKLHISKSKGTLNMKILKKIKMKQTVGFKPGGIWSSGLFEKNQNSWTDWVYSEDMLDWIDPKKCFYYAIKIIDDPKLILKINTVKRVERFHEKYHTKKDNYVVINWKKVQDDGYYGVDFSKYFDNIKNNKKYLWYNTLDAASQCIWDGRAFEDIKKLK